MAHGRVLQSAAWLDLSCVDKNSTLPRQKKIHKPPPRVALPASLWSVAAYTPSPLSRYMWGLHARHFSGRCLKIS
uniref:Uncharacterized protein n=1 Tax=Timema bartmani TaxID=61472 RepID=A0A7R9EZ08_9NEOP|nr:unnamed protein product [Timema bartmani]